METAKIDELRALWERLLGNPPELMQFEVWALSNDYELIRHGIIKTVEKYMAVGRVMDQDHRRRYCSAVMINIARSPRPLTRVKL